MLNLEDKLYSSTEVAEILGVSLRSIYRYLEENKLDADVKTATGRHRFTKKNILDFLYPENATNNTSKPSSSNVTSALKNDAVVSFSATNNTSNPILNNVNNSESLKSASTTVVNTFEENDSEEENVDWLAQFKAAAQMYQSEESEDTSTETPYNENVNVQTSSNDSYVNVSQFIPSNATNNQTFPENTNEEEEIIPISFVQQSNQPSNSQNSYQDFEEQFTSNLTTTTFQTNSVTNNAVNTSKVEAFYYHSGIGVLKSIAQNLDSSARKASLDYALTMVAGLSLHKLTKPFSIIYTYIRPEDKPFFEKILQLTPSDKENAHLCLLVTSNDMIFNESDELHGLFVVSKTQLRLDLESAGDFELAKLL